MSLLRRASAPRTFTAAVLGLSLPLVVACGSGTTTDFASNAAGGPASAAPVHESGGQGGASSNGQPASGAVGPDGGTLGAFGQVTTSSFTLVDTTITTVAAGSAVPGFDPIKYGATIDLGVVGDKLSIRADPPPVAAVGSMAFALDATYTYTANTSPYSLCGDDGKGKFNACDLPVGKHTLTVTPYPETRLGGTPYTPTIFEFTVVDSASDAGADAGTD